MNSELDGHPNPMEGMPLICDGLAGAGPQRRRGSGGGRGSDGIDKKVYCIIGEWRVSRGPDPTEALDGHHRSQKLSNVLPIFN